MAKEDFCFTYYDGDAARDMAHMNRLERGAYNDLMVSQRKFGHLSITLIKKTLGNDFNDTWEAIEIILKKDGQEKYYIEWLEKSLSRDKNFSNAQSDRGKKGGRPKKENSENHVEKNPDETRTKPGDKPEQKPLEKKSLKEDEDEDEEGDVFEEKKEKKEGFEKFEKILIPEMLKVWKIKKPNYPEDKNKDLWALGEIAKFISDQLNIPYHPRDGDLFDKILSNWGVMAEFVSKANHFNSYNLGQVAKYSQTIVQNIQNGDSKNGKSGAGKVTGEQLDQAFAKRYSQRK